MTDTKTPSQIYVVHLQETQSELLTRLKPFAKSITTLMDFNPPHDIGCRETHRNHVIPIDENIIIRMFVGYPAIVIQGTLFTENMTILERDSKSECILIDRVDILNITSEQIAFVTLLNEIWADYLNFTKSLEHQKSQAKLVTEAVAKTLELNSQKYSKSGSLSHGKYAYWDLHMATCLVERRSTRVMLHHDVLQSLLANEDLDEEYTSYLGESFNSNVQDVLDELGYSRELYDKVFASGLEMHQQITHVAKKRPYSIHLNLPRTIYNIENQTMTLEFMNLMLIRMAESYLKKYTGEAL